MGNDKKDKLHILLGSKVGVFGLSHRLGRDNERNNAKAFPIPFSVFIT